MKIFTKEPKIALPNIKRAFYFLHDWGTSIPSNWMENSQLRHMFKTHPVAYDYNFAGSVSIDYKVPAHTIRSMVDAIATDDNLETVLFGTGAGAWLARLIQLGYYKSAATRDPESAAANKVVWALGLNPMIEPHVKLRGETMKMHTNPVTGKEFPWNRFDCEEMQMAHESVDFRDSEVDYVAAFTPSWITPTDIDYHKPFSHIITVGRANKKITHLELFKTTLNYFESYRNTIFESYLNTGQIKA